MADYQPVDAGGCAPPVYAAQASKPQSKAIAIQHRASILQRIADGERLTDIAHSLGLKDHSAIVHRLKDDPDYLVAREIGAEVRLERRERELEGADESVTVARARELLSHQRWRCEREFPRRWGAKQENTLTIQVDETDALVGSAGDLLARMRSRRRQSEDAQIVDAEQQTDDQPILFGKIAP